MNKKLILPFAAAAMLLLTACNETTGGGASMPTGATTADSLMFYLGQMNGAQYAMMAARDTTLDTPGSKQAYLAGYKAALNLPKDEDEAFNRGLADGMQMGGSLIQFVKEYGVQVDKRVLLSALTATINSDSTLNQTELQANFNKVFEELRIQKEEKDKAAALESLSQEVSGKDFTKITDDLYGKVIEKNDSAKLEDGNMVNLQITATTSNGKEITAPFPRQARVGAPNVSEAINDAVKFLRTGEEGEFMTTAHTLFGARARQLNLEPTDVVTLKVKASVKPEKKEE